MKTPSRHSFTKCQRPDCGGQVVSSGGEWACLLCARPVDLVPQELPSLELPRTRRELSRPNARILILSS